LGGGGEVALPIMAYTVLFRLQVHIRRKGNLSFSYFEKPAVWGKERGLTNQLEIEPSLIFGKLKFRLYFRFCNRSKSGFKIDESNGGRKTSKIIQISLLARFPQWRAKPDIRL